MNQIEEFIKKYDKPLTHEEINKIIYNTFCIIIFLLPVIPEQIGFGIYSLKNTLFNSFTIITAITLIILNIKNIKLNIYDKILSVYLLLVTLSTIFTKFGILDAILGSNGRGEGLITIFSYIATFVIFSRGYKYISSTVKLALVGAIVVSIYAFIEANAPMDVKLPFTKRRIEGVATGTMKNQNMLSSYICIFLPAICYYYINSKNNKTIIAVILLFMALIFSVTLGGYITFSTMYVAVLIVSMLFSKDRKATFIRIIIITTVIGLSFLGTKLLKGDIYEKEVVSAKQEVTHLVEKNEKFGTGRMEIWKRTLALIRDNIWLGTGPDSLYLGFSNANYEINGENDILNSYIVDKAHSEPLHMAATTGLPSAVIYLFLMSFLCIRLLILAVKNIKRKGIRDKENLFVAVVLVSILSYLMQSMVNISVVQVAPTFWALAGIGAGLTLDYKYNK